MPQISVIIPLFNKGRYIQQALNSVLAQTFGDYEIIVVDDGSTDNGAELVSNYCDQRIRLIRQENAGPGAARNYGIRNSCAEYVAFLDADDEWMPEFLENSLDNILQNPGCVLSTCNSYEEEKKQPTTRTKMAALSHGIYRLPPDVCPKKLVDITGCVQVGSVLGIKEAIKRYGGFYEGGCIWGEDRYLWLQVLLNHAIYYDSRKMFWYHTESSELLVFNMKKWFQPIITDPEPIRSNCPQAYKNTLERHLAIYAINEFHNYFSKDRIIQIKKILLDHPLAFRATPFKYLLLKLKMMFPSIVDKWRKRYA